VNAIQKLNLILTAPNLGLLILRVWLGVVGIFHGSQKLFGIWGGHGMAGFTDFLTSLNVPVPAVSAYLAAGAEFLGGILLIVGLFARLAAIPFAITMAVAIATVHNKAFANPEGFEFPATVLAGLIAVIFLGPGRFSADASIGKATANITPKP
jgi:putative oxidoreductase